MKQLTSLMAFALLVMAGGCHDPGSEEIGKLKKECIGVHDEVMPRMGELADLRHSLREWKKQLDMLPADSLATLNGTVFSHIRMLDSADEAMMDWMANYNPEYEGAHAADSAVAYYTDQKKQIIEVKTLMERSINDANKLLEKHP